MTTKIFALASVVVPPVNESRLPAGSGGEFVDSWQAYLVEVAYHLREVVATDPHVLGALIDTTTTAWWLQPPLGDLVLVDDFLAAMNRYGFDDEDTAALYLAFFARLLSLLIIQAPAQSRPAPDSVSDLGAYPTLTRLRPWLTAQKAKDTFEDGLDDILSNLERDFQRKLRSSRRFAVSSDLSQTWRP